MKNLCFSHTPFTVGQSRSSIVGRPLGTNTRPTKVFAASSFSMATTRPSKELKETGRFDGEYEPEICLKRIPSSLDDVLALEKEMATGPLESVCGATWDAQQVESYDGSLGVSREFVNEHQAAVGLVRWRSDIQDRYRNPGRVAGMRWCSGTMISTDIFLSAGHNFDFSNLGYEDFFPTYNDGSPIPDSELVRELIVEMNYQRDPLGNLRQRVTYPVEALVEKVNENGVNFGMIRLGRTDGKLPGEVFGTNRVSDVDAKIGDMCCIIGHPAGRPKAIEEGTVDQETSLRLKYGDIDTIGVNSGTGILRAKSSDIVGVHTNGGCTATGGFNSGMKISGILERSPTLRRIVREMQWGRLIRIPGWYGWHNQGGGIAFGSISSATTTDLIAMHIDNPERDNAAYYRIGRNVQKDPNGAVTIESWTDPIKVPGWFGYENQGGGVAFGNIKSTTSKDLIIFHIDNPEGDNHGYYRVGYGIDENGIATGGWSEVIQVPGWFGHHNQGGGIRSSTSNDLVVMHLDNPERSNRAYYRVGFDLGPDGTARGGWSDPMVVPGWFGWENEGGGVALFDTNGNEKLDIVVFHIDNPRMDNHGYYRVGYDLDENGVVTGGCSTLHEVPDRSGGRMRGAVLRCTNSGPAIPRLRYSTLIILRRKTVGMCALETGL